MERLKGVFVLLLCFGYKLFAQSTVERVGDVALYSSPLVVLGAAILENDKDGLYMYAKSFALNVTITLSLKEITKKERPNGEDDKSFPSGHTSATFQAAAYLQKRYGWKYGITAYTIAAYTGFSRIYAKKHYVEDVVAGATLGILSSYLFTHKFEKKNSLSFSFGNKQKYLAINYLYNF